MSTESDDIMIDPRGPRFGAAITMVGLTIALWLALPAATAPGSLDAGWWLVLVLWASFLWGTIAGPSKHPYGALFRALVRPRLQPPAYLEPESPPRFAQGVGLLVTSVGLLLHLLVVPWGLVIATAIAFIAAFLNAIFGLCLGCEMYGLLVRLGIIRGASPSAS